MAEAKLKLQPFRVPNYVLADAPARPRHEGYVETPKFALGELDDETLAELCDDFRRAVFAKAGRRDPRESSDD